MGFKSGECASHFCMVGIRQPARAKNADKLDDKFAAVRKTQGSFRAKAAIKDGPLPIATKGKAAQVSLEISREIRRLEPEVALETAMPL